MPAGAVGRVNSPGPFTYHCPAESTERLPLYWPLSDALHLPVHVEFQNKRRRLVVVLVLVVVAIVVVVVVVVVAAPYMRVGSFRRSRASETAAGYDALARPRRDRRLYFPPLLQPVFPASARRVFVLSHIVLLPLAFCSRIRTPFVRQFASLLILGHGRYKCPAIDIQWRRSRTPPPSKKKTIGERGVLRDVIMK